MPHPASPSAFCAPEILPNGERFCLPRLHRIQFHQSHDDFIEVIGLWCLLVLVPDPAPEAARFFGADTSHLPWAEVTATSGLLAAGIPKGVAIWTAERGALTAGTRSQARRRISARLGPKGPIAGDEGSWPALGVSGCQTPRCSGGISHETSSEQRAPAQALMPRSRPPSSLFPHEVDDARDRGTRRRTPKAKAGSGDSRPGLASESAAAPSGFM